MDHVSLHSEGKKLCASAGFSRRFTIFEGSFISIIIALDRNLQLARVSGHFQLTAFLLGSGCHKLQERSISPQICLHWNFDPMLEAKQTRTAQDFQQKSCGRLGACQVELYYQKNGLLLKKCEGVNCILNLPHPAVLGLWQRRAPHNLFNLPSRLI